MKKNTTNKIKKRIGDRYDGRRVRHSDPANVIIPFIMKTRNDAQVEFDAEIDISNVENRIRERRKNGESISFLDYFFTALIRTVAEYPRLNRFIAGRRLYSRDDLALSIVVKKEMNIETEATPVKMIFEKDSSVDDVAELLQKTITANKGGTGIKNDTDKFMNIINRLPRFLFSFVIDFLTFLDFYGHMPKFIHRLSPFHTSMFVTCVYGMIDIKSRNFYFINCGHLSPIIVSKNEYPLFLKSNNNIALGIVNDFDFVLQKVYVPEDSYIVLYTDGVVEAINEKNEEYDYYRLNNLLYSMKDYSSEKIVNAINEDVKNFANNTKQFDDITSVVINLK